MLRHSWSGTDPARPVGVNQSLALGLVGSDRGLPSRLLSPIEGNPLVRPTPRDLWKPAASTTSREKDAAGNTHPWKF
jgi:hypothetical protein